MRYLPYHWLNSTHSSKCKGENNELSIIFQYYMQIFEPCKKSENNFIANKEFISYYNITICIDYGENKSPCLIEVVTKAGLTVKLKELPA